MFRKRVYKCEAIIWVGYDRDRQVLWIHSRNTAPDCCFEYSPVPHELYLRFPVNQNAINFFQQHINGLYARHIVPRDKYLE